MSRRRKHITLKTKLAAALCQMVEPGPDGKLVKVIPHDQAKKMTEDEVLRVFEWDHHPIPKAFEGPDVHWNLDPRPKADHRSKSAKSDIPRIAKAKRVARKEAIHALAMHRAGEAEMPQATKRKRAMAGSKASGWKKPMNGKWERRA